MKNPSSKRQQGAALLMMMLALIAISSALAYQYLGEMNQKLKRQSAQEIGVALEEAKQNLLAFAASIPELYDVNTGVGYMPTPDFDNDGRQGSFSELPNIWYNTNNNNVIGRLPSFNKNSNSFYFMPRQCASSGSACVDEGANSIWVAFSGRTGNGDLRLQAKSKLNTNYLKENLDGNSDSHLTASDCNIQGIVCVDGIPVVAVLIVAGAPLSNQTARSTSPNDFRQYLDSKNADNDIYNFVSRFPSDQVCSSSNTSDCFNDRVLAITYEDWLNAMLPKVLPYCSAMNKPAWFTSNNWSVICP